MTIAPIVYSLPFEKVCDHEEEPCPPLRVAVVAPHPAPKEPKRKSVLADLYALFASILQGECSPIMFTWGLSFKFRSKITAPGTSGTIAFPTLYPLLSCLNKSWTSEQAS